jgi:hypothetical protein
VEELVLDLNLFLDQLLTFNNNHPGTINFQADFPSREIKICLVNNLGDACLSLVLQQNNAKSFKKRLPNCLKTLDKEVTFSDNKAWGNNNHNSKVNFPIFPNNGLK